MASSQKLLALGVMLTIGAACGTAVFAADKEQVIRDRQALMKEQGANAGAIKGYLDGKVDQAKAIAAATDLVATMKKIPDVFPAGTEGPNPEGKFLAKPEIWTDQKGFLAIRDAGIEKAQTLLAAVKGGDKTSIQTAFADLGKGACGACHEKFREEIKK